MDPPRPDDLCGAPSPGARLRCSVAEVRPTACSPKPPPGRLLAVLSAFFILLALGVLPHAAAADGPPTLAIADLDNDTGDPSFDVAGPGLASILITRFARTESVRVVERGRLRDVLAEIELGASGALDPDTAAQAGKLLGADYVVLGSIFTVRLPSIAVSVRIVAVQTGEVVVAEEVTGEVGERGEEFFVLVDELAFALLDGLEVRLASRERIEFSQVDVRQLETVSLYGEALQAMERGQRSEAESLLGRALALEPGFRLAEETLATIAADISQRRTTIAHRSVVEVHELWDRVRQTAADETWSQPPSGEELCRAGLRSRLMLVDGQPLPFLEAERARLVGVEAALDGLDYDEARVLHDVHDTCWRDALLAAGADRQKSTTFREPPFWPYELKAGIADILLRLGRRDEAVATQVDAWQHRGPRPPRYGGPAHPRSWARKNGLLDLAVVLQQQELRKAELAGDAEAVGKELDKLEDLVGDAREARERDRAWADFVQAAASAPASDKDLIRVEKTAMRAPAKTMHLRGVAYRDFLRRVEEGWYDELQQVDPRRFAELAKAWKGVADANWDAHPFVERRLAHLLTLHGQLPEGDEEEQERRRRQLEDFATGRYQP